MKWKISLPMYNVSPALRRSHEALLECLVMLLRESGWQDAIELEREPALPGCWRDPDLLMSQTCGYPYMTQLRGHVTLLATPCFNLPGCAGSDYASAIVVRADGPIQTLEGARGRVAAANERLSNSGMNALRHTFAPLARDGRFFSAVTWSGSHAASLRLLQRGQADIAAIDCVTYAYIKQQDPASVEGLCVLRYSAAAPGLPLITGPRVPAHVTALLRASLLAPSARLASVMHDLRINAFVHLDDVDYDRVLLIEATALEQGYGELR